LKSKIIKYFGDSSQEYAKILQEKFINVTDDNRIHTDYVCFMEQIHSSNVVVIDGVITPPAIVPQCDGLITSNKNIFLAVKTADCYPILIYDDVKGIIAIAHSGREGTKQKILEKIIELMKNIFFCEPENIKIEIGAGICAKHYQVSNQIANEFINIFPDLEITELLDLPKVIIDTALKNGVVKKNIITSTECTFENEKYFSFRRDKENKRQVSLIGMS